MQVHVQIQRRTKPLNDRSANSSDGGVAPSESRTATPAAIPAVVPPATAKSMTKILNIGATDLRDNAARGDRASSESLPDLEVRVAQRDVDFD
jgi:hypothetical protein